MELESEPLDDSLPDDLGTDEIGDDQLTPADLANLVLYTLDWSVQSLLERIGTTFNINPHFQRRDAWTHDRKSRYLESLILGLPVPQIVVAEDGRNKGQFIVLDGKQRLITIKQFAAPDATYKEFRLRELDFLPDLQGSSFADLNGSLTNRDYAASFLSQPVRTIVVRNWNKDAVLYHIFVRLNQNSLSLSPQELRQALFPGPFTHWIDDRSAGSVLIQQARGIPGPDFRMRDAEMLLRVLALQDRLEDYSGNLREFLDSTCRRGNEEWPDRSLEYETQADQLEIGIATAISAFGDDSFRRFDGEKYIRRFNVAVFDTMTLVLQSVESPLAAETRDLLKSRFEDLCRSDSDFERSLVTTTKTAQATLGRIAKWGETVGELLGVDIPIASRARRSLESR